MHIEPGLVDASKIALRYATATAALGTAAKLSWKTRRKESVRSLNLQEITSSSAACISVVRVEPLVEIGGRALATLGHRMTDPMAVGKRWYNAI